MGIMYPVLNFRAAINQVNTLYDHICPSTEPVTREELLSDEDLNILKMIFACALTAEANGKSDLAMKIFRDVRDVASDVVWQPPNIKRVILITLVVRRDISLFCLFSTILTCTVDLPISNRRRGSGLA